MDKVERAKIFCRGAHLGQKHGERPYWAHPRDVVRTLESWGYHDENLLAAAWLHDTIEDTPATYQTIIGLFGREVAETVWAVTDELGRNRAERWERTREKIFEHYHPMVLKFADYYSNVARSLENPGGKLDMYRKEAKDLLQAFANAIVYFDAQERLGPVLEDLSRKLFPKTCEMCLKLSMDMSHVNPAALKQIKLDA